MHTAKESLYEGSDYGGGINFYKMWNKCSSVGLKKNRDIYN